MNRGAGSGVGALMTNATDAEQILETTEEVGKLLRSLIRALQDSEAV
jgi:hypothetical protein